MKKCKILSIAGQLPSKKINNDDISDLPVYVRTKRFKISIIPQFGGLFASLTTEQNIRAVAEILIKDKSFIDIKINEMAQEASENILLIKKKASKEIQALSKKLAPEVVKAILPKSIK